MAGLVKGKTIGIDATTLEANAALRSIVRRDTGESYEEFLTMHPRAALRGISRRPLPPSFRHPNRRACASANRVSTPPWILHAQRYHVRVLGISEERSSPPDACRRPLQSGVPEHLAPTAVVTARRVRRAIAPCRRTGRPGCPRSRSA
jgi:hypothetical protein